MFDVVIRNKLWLSPRKQVFYVQLPISLVSRILWFNKRNIWLNLTHIDLTVVYAELYC